MSLRQVDRRKEEKEENDHPRISLRANKHSGNGGCVQLQWRCCWKTCRTLSRSGDQGNRVDICTSMEELPIGCSWKSVSGSLSSNYLTCKTTMTIPVRCHDGSARPATCPALFLPSHFLSSFPVSQDRPFDSPFSSEGFGLYHCVGLKRLESARRAPIGSLNFRQKTKW